MGKEREYGGVGGVEARMLWEEVQRELGVVLGALVRGKVFSEEEVGELRGGRSRILSGGARCEM